MVYPVGSELSNLGNVDDFDHVVVPNLLWREKFSVLSLSWRAELENKVARLVPLEVNESNFGAKLKDKLKTKLLAEVKKIKPSTTIEEIMEMVSMLAKSSFVLDQNRQNLCKLLLQAKYIPCSLRWSEDSQFLLDWAHKSRDTFRVDASGYVVDKMSGTLTTAMHKLHLSGEANLISAAKELGLSFCKIDEKGKYPFEYAVEMYARKQISRGGFVEAAYLNDCIVSFLNGYQKLYKKYLNDETNARINLYIEKFKSPGFKYELDTPPLLAENIIQEEAIKLIGLGSSLSEARCKKRFCEYINSLDGISEGDKFELKNLFLKVSHNSSIGEIILKFTALTAKVGCSELQVRQIIKLAMQRKLFPDPALVVKELEILVKTGLLDLNKIVVEVINSEMEDKSSVIKMLVENGRLDLDMVLLEVIKGKVTNKAEICKYLREKGANVNCPGKGTNALFEAFRVGDVRLALSLSTKAGIAIDHTTEYEGKIALQMLPMDSNTDKAGLAQYLTNIAYNGFLTPQLVVERCRSYAVFSGAEVPRCIYAAKATQEKLQTVSQRAMQIITVADKVASHEGGVIRNSTSMRLSDAVTPTKKRPLTLDAWISPSSRVATTGAASHSSSSVTRNN